MRWGKWLPGSTAVTLEVRIGVGARPQHGRHSFWIGGDGSPESWLCCEHKVGVSWAEDDTADHRKALGSTGATVGLVLERHAGSMSPLGTTVALPDVTMEAWMEGLLKTDDTFFLVS